MINELLEINSHEVSSLIKELVQIPTQNPPGLERTCSEFIVEKLSSWNIQADLIPEPYPNRPQAFGQIQGGEDGPTLILNGHMDVVPEGDPARWKYPPYEGKIDDGFIFGRGACDMKGGLAAMMITAKRLNKVKDRMHGKLILQFAIGEETGEPGTKHLLLDSGLRGDYGIVLEPTALQIATAEKGLAWFRIRIEGRPVHASVAEQGINAIEKAGVVITEIQKYNTELSQRVHPLVGPAKCSITMIEGGTKENVIAESCSLVLDRRLNPDEPIDQVKTEIRSILDGIASQDPDFKYSLDPIMLYESAEIPPDSHLAQVVRKHARQVANVAMEPYGTRFSTDVRNFINDARMEAITFGPGETNVAHTLDEYIEIDQVVKCIKILLLTSCELFAIEDR